MTDQGIGKTISRGNPWTYSFCRSGKRRPLHSRWKCRRRSSMVSWRITRMEEKSRARQNRHIHLRLRLENTSARTSKIKLGFILLIAHLCVPLRLRLENTLVRISKFKLGFILLISHLCVFLQANGRKWDRIAVSEDDKVYFEWVLNYFKRIKRNLHETPSKEKLLK